MEPFIELKDIRKYYGHKNILECSLSVQKGESLAILGANGSGKSTLLRLLAGVILPNTGRVLSSKKLRIGYVPERFPRDLRFTPTEYLTLMGNIQGLGNPYLPKRIADLLSLFRLEDAANQRMSSLSKGMVQKVAIAQAILSSPDLLLLDEPLSGLDLQSQKDLHQFLHDVKNQGVTLVFTVHEPSLLSLADRVIVIKNGSIDLDMLSEDISQPSMVIEVENDNPLPLAQQIAQWEGIKNIYEQQIFLEVHVNPEKSDEVLLKLLKGGNSIRSVYLYEPLLEWTKTKEGFKK